MVKKKRDNTKTAIEIIDILRVDKISREGFEEIYLKICQEYELKALFPEEDEEKTGVTIHIIGDSEQIVDRVETALNKVSI